jgi:hypothetical protein
MVINGGTGESGRKLKRGVNGQRLGSRKEVDEDRRWKGKMRKGERNGKE